MTGEQLHSILIKWVQEQIEEDNQMKSTAETGVRPLTPDGRPILEFAPGVEGDF